MEGRVLPSAFCWRIDLLLVGFHQPACHQLDTCLSLVIFIHEFVFLQESKDEQERKGCAVEEREGHSKFDERRVDW
jgi:hypothetical protein